ncbi:MAG: lytic transglycosylase domain-containing protein [Alphaproteobacteria bacterium]|nr:lytic transglycosylase domain-containing protein [Alphaproteobacteria bacterium]
MGGIGGFFDRLPVAAAVLVVVGLLGTLGPRPALAQPRPDPFPAASEEAFAPLRPGLPHPLAPSTAARLRWVFARLEHGDDEGAARAAAWLRDPSPLAEAMRGHVLAALYLDPDTRPDAAALEDWLERWPDLPDAPAIERLLHLRLPPDAKPPATATTTALLDTAPPPDEDEAGEIAITRNPELDRDVRAAARVRGGDAVQRLLARTRGLSAQYAAELRGEAAQILFTVNRDDEALALAAPAARQATAAGYAAGLAAWRLHRWAQAGSLFEAAWHAPLGAPALRSASAFWAARAHRRAGDAAGASGWLLRAAEQPRSFYGMLARRRLGLRLRFAAGERETLGVADAEAVAATAPGLRALALLQIGQQERAEAEFRLLSPTAQASRPFARAVMLIAERAGLADTAAQFADLLAAADGRPHEALRFPIPPLRPAGGFRVERAMLYGIVRAESNFDAALVSSAGARGLLQIMPETARDVLGRPLDPSRLHDPAVNLDLGQRYLAFLAGQSPVDDDLIRVIASYNTGLGSYMRWGPTVRDDGDPLLFIEAIPIDETRAYVRRVLTYTWIYAARLHAAAPGLDELAEGLWPRYDAARP